MFMKLQLGVPIDPKPFGHRKWLQRNKSSIWARQGDVWSKLSILGTPGMMHELSLVKVKQESKAFSPLFTECIGSLQDGNIGLK
jgi:hypothetical protein